MSVNCEHAHVYQPFCSKSLYTKDTKKMCDSSSDVGESSFLETVKSVPAVEEKVLVSIFYFHCQFVLIDIYLVALLQTYLVIQAVCQ